MWFYAILRLKSNYKPREGKRHQMHRLQPSYIQKKSRKMQISTFELAAPFLCAAKCLNHKVFIQLADIDSPQQLLSQDIQYHPTCMRSYLLNFDNLERVCIICLKQCHRRNMPSEKHAIGF